jgi:hypothetical protein
VDVQRDALRRSALALVALIAWVGVLLQLYLSAHLPLSSGKSVVEGLVAFFGYFTVLTNIFVALAAALPVMFGRSRLGRWFGTGMVLGCAVTAIVLVGVGYHFLLRNVWTPQGLQWIADVMLHYVVPMAYFAYWILFPPMQRLPLWAPLAWCLYPLAYAWYVFARGELLGSYPYHFIDVTSLGYPKALINSLGLLVAFVVIGSVVYGIARFRKRTLGPIRTAS